MTTDMQRVAIARHAGWTCCGHMTGMDPWGLPPHLNISNYDAKQIMDREVPIDTLPDYTGDLNAIHALVHAMPEEQFVGWCLRLMKIADGLESYRATAGQCCEAFLKTLNLWIE